MNRWKRLWKMELSEKEKRWGKKIMASIVLPIFLFYSTSFNFVALSLLKTQAADGSGTMTVNDDKVTAGGPAQDFKFTFDPSEDMDGGSVEVEFPSPFPEPSFTEGSNGEVVVSAKGGSVLGEVTKDDRKVTIPIVTMAANQYFTVTYKVTSAMPTTIGDYQFTTKSKLAGGSLVSLGSSRQASIKVEPAPVASYQISAIGNQTVGVNFNVTVTAKDAYGNITTGSDSVDIKVKTGNGNLVGDTSADTSKNGTDTVTLKYTKVENEVVLEADDGTIDDDSNSFNVANLTAPTFSSPGSSTNDSTPLINWSDVAGTNVEYEMWLTAKTADSCASQNYGGALLNKDTDTTSQYQVAAGEALLDETTYCVKVTAMDGEGFDGTVDAYKQFSLLTSKPAAPTKVYIEESGSIADNGHPENTINIYNNENVSVKVAHAGTLDGGKVYVKIKDGLNNETDEYSADITGVATSTTVSGIDAADLQQGNNLEIYARVEDAGTNSSDWATTTDKNGTADDVVKDTSAPARPSAVSFLDDPVNAGNVDEVNIQVTGEGSVTAYYNITSSGGGTAVSGNFVMEADGNTNSSDLDVDDLGDGTLTATVYLVDNAWNHSSSKTGTVMKDATAPTTTVTIAQNKYNAAGWNNTNTINGTASDANSVTSVEVAIMREDGATDHWWDGTDWDATSETWVTATGTTNWTYALDKANLTDGKSYTVKARATDGVGNVTSTGLGEDTFTYDTTAPTLSFTDNVAAGPVASDTITGSWGDASTKKWDYFTDEDLSSGNCPSTASSYSKTSGDSIDQTNETNNGKWVCLFGEDEAGNSAVLKSANKINIDKTGPTLSFTDDVAAGPVASDTITGSWGDASVKKWDYDNDGVCSVNGGDYTKADGDSMNQSNETNNGKWICLYGEDNLGNKTTLASANPINIDITSPVIAFTDDVGAGPVPSETIKITVTETNPDTTTFKYGFSNDATCDGNDAYENSFTSGVDFVINNESNNGKYICAKAVDKAGNTTYQVSGNKLNIDATVPTITKITSTTDNGNYNAGKNINVEVHFSEAVTLIGGSLNVTLDTGDVVAIAAFGPATTASGTYTVGSGDNSADLDAVGVALGTGATLKDAAGNDANIALPGTTIADEKAIVIDTTNPTVAITAPNNGDYKGGAFVISGTSSDGTIGSGIAGVEVLIQQDSDDKYWDGDSWETSKSWLGATMNGNDWSYNFTANLADTTYFIDARATDKAGNTTAEANYSRINVLGDVSAPDSAITNPANGAFLKTLTLLSGTAADGRSGVDNVKVAIKRNSDNKYWTGSDWGNETPLSTTYNADNWVKNSGLPNWEDGQVYTIYSTAWDKVDNDEDVPASASFTFDTTAPTVTVNSLTTNDTTPQLTGTVNDATATIQVTVNGHSYNATNNGNGTWTLPDGTISALTENTYDVAVAATDPAGNVGNDATTNELIIDTTNPVVDAGADIVTNSLPQTLAATVNASIAGVKTYAWSKTAGPGDVTFSATNVEDPNVTAINTQGTYTLQLVVTDNADNSASDTMNFTYDTTDPTITLNVVAPDPTTDNTPTLTGNATDVLTNIVSVEYEIDGNGTWIAATASDGAFNGLNENYTFTVASLTDGEHTIKTRTTDAAGNIVDAGNYASDTFVVDTTNPSAPTYNSSEANDVWYKSNPTLDIDFADNIKIDKVEYKVNAGGNWRTIATGINAATYTANWSIDNADWTAMSESTNYLYFRVTDYAGNQYTTGNDTDGFRFKKDITNPNAPTYNTTEDQWFNANPTLDIDFSDARSIYSVEYQVDGTSGSWTTLGTGLSGTSYATNWSMTNDIWNGLSEGQHYLYFRVYDDAGNEYVTSDNAAGFSFKRDTTAPSAISNLTANPAKNVWTKDNNVVFYWDDSTDGGSGLVGYSYTIDHAADTTPDNVVDSTTSAYTSNELADDNDWYFHIKAIDSAGNSTAVVHEGPFKIDTTDPKIEHTVVDEADTGDPIQISADVTDDGSGVDKVFLHWKQKGGTWNEEEMNKGSGNTYTETIPAQYNPNVDIEYYIEAKDKLGNESFKGTSSNPYTIDIVAETDKFVISTDTTQTDSSPFAATITAKDEYNNDAYFTGTVVISVDAYDESKSSWIDLDENSYKITVNGVERDFVVFNNQVSRSVIVVLHGEGATAFGKIRIHAEKSGDASIFGNSADITITGFKATAVAGATEGAEVGTGGESVVNGESPMVEGAEDGALVPNNGKQMTDGTMTPWWKKYLPWMEGLFGLAFVGWFIRFWIRRRGGGAGGGVGLLGFLFSSMKTAAHRIRMFLW